MKISVKVLKLIIGFISVVSGVCLAKTISSLNDKKYVLSDRSFAIQTSVARYSAYKQLQSVHLSEKYSHEQKRAKIKYHLSSKQQQQGNDNVMFDEFYYDFQTGASISFSREYLVCDDETIDDLYVNLFATGSVQMVELMQLADTELSNYLIGPARLLFLVASRVDEMRAIFWPAGQKSTTIRNHQVVEFALELNSKQRKFLLSVYYDRPALEEAKRSLERIVPLQIVIKGPGLVQPVVVDYYKYELLNDATWEQQTWPIEHDEFTFPVALNCTALLAPQLPLQDLFSSYDFESLRLSFRASSWLQMAKIGKNQLDHFVAYDGMTQSMRIDYMESIQKATDYSTCLIDFRTGRIHSSIDTSRRGCLVTQTLKAAGLEASEVPLTLGRLLVGSDRNLTYMGLARVRGFRARVFEVYSDQLAQWFSQPQPVRFMSRTGPLLKRHFGAGLAADKESSEERQQQRYSTLVYMTEDLSRLLQLEVYDLNRFKWLHEQRIIFSAVIKDFLFELNEATNGDSKTNLFDLQDRCGSIGPNDGYAQVELLLEEDEKSKDEEESEGDSGNWLVNYIKRNDALLSSFRDSLNLPTNLIYQLESKITQSPNEKVKLIVSFRVADHPRHFHIVHFLDNAEVKSLKGLEVIHSVQSPNECYLKLLSKQTSEEVEEPIYLFYEQQSSRCLANRDHKVKDEKKKISQSGLQVDLRKLEQFVLGNTDFSGELFMFEPSKDFALTLANSWLREEKFEHLEGRLLVLQTTRPGDPRRPLEPHEVRVRIRRARLRGVNQVSRVAAAGDLHKRKQLIGVSLSPEAETNLVVAKEATSLTTCEASCLEASWCRLYSFCLRHSEPQCLLSVATLLDENQDQQVVATLTMADLVADARCELREKLYLDLFKLGWPKTQTLGANVQAVATTNTAEDCARLCFIHNLELLESSSVDYSSFCRQFIYLNSELNELQPSTKGSPEALNKYCLFEQLLLGNQISQTFEISKSVTFGYLDTFQFKFELLYERVQGIGLLGSTHNEDNFQVRFEQLDSATCAEYCLLQLTPAITCRSFDTQTIANNTICILNSASMRQTSELIRQAPDGVQLWHYEPRFEFFEVYGTLQSFDNSSSSLEWKRALFSLLWIIASIASGLWLGRQFGQHLLRTDQLDLDDGIAMKLAQHDYQQDLRLN